MVKNLYCGLAGGFHLRGARERLDAQQRPPAATPAGKAAKVKCFNCQHLTSATLSLKPYYSASATGGVGVPSSSREKESLHEDESIDSHGRWCSGSLDRWCYVDRTIGVGW